MKRITLPVESYAKMTEAERLKSRDDMKALGFDLVLYGCGRNGIVAFRINDKGGIELV